MSYFPGSMPPNSHSIFDEGAVFMSFKLVDGGIFQEKGNKNLKMSAQLLQVAISISILAIHSRKHFNSFSSLLYVQSFRKTR